VSRSACLRELLGGRRLVRVVGAHDGLSARLVERSGFDAVWASGLEVSTSHGLPDAGILTMCECLDAARVMTETVSIPVIADCDTGFGDVSHVVRTVRRYEMAGIAAVCIEDKCFPKLNSFVSVGQELISVEAFVEKISAAKQAQRTAEFVVIGRTEAFIAGCGVEEALTRAAAYADAGADAVLVHSRASTPGEIWAFMERWDRDVPVVVVPTTYRASVEELQSRGVRVAIHANVGIRAAARAMEQAFLELHQHGTVSPSLEDRLASVDELLELQGMPAVIEARR
jgi:phosphoenolpyruvate phosphomutase